MSKYLKVRRIKGCGLEKNKYKSLEKADSEEIDEEKAKESI